MKKISIIVGDITKFGGTERAVTNLANLLVTSFDISIVSVYKGNYKPYFKFNDNISVIYLNVEKSNSIIQRFYQYFVLTFALRNICKNKSIDIIIGTGHAFNFLLPIVTLFLRTKTIAAEHITRSSLPIISRLFQRISYQYLNALVVLSPSAKNKYHFCNNIHIIPNSLPFSCSEQSKLNNNTIISVGRLSYEKGYDRLIEMASLLKSKCKDGSWKIKIFGNGDIENELKDTIANNALSDFVSLNNAVRDIQHEYLNSDIYLMTSRFEAFPMVLLEAKACGLPVVSYDCPEGPREIISDGVDGFLIENGNINEMTDRLLLLMADPNLRKFMGENAKNSICDYKDDVIFSKWNEVINNL
jgi:glycosyltransferase involved in cell wall biosynthesis